MTTRRIDPIVELGGTFSLNPGRCVAPLPCVVIMAANNVTITGTAADNANSAGICFTGTAADGNITATNGILTLNGTDSGTAGISSANAVESLTGNSVVLNSNAPNGRGVLLDNLNIQATNGTVTVYGSGNTGVSILSGDTSLSSTGGVTISGSATSATGIAVEINTGQMNISGNGATTITDTLASAAATSIDVGGGGGISNAGAASPALTGVRNNVIVNGSIDNGANGLTIGAGTSYAAGNANLANGNVTFTGQITDTGNVHIYSGGITQTTFNGSINGSSPFIAGSGSFRYNAAYGDTPNAAATVGNGLDYVLYREQPTVTVTSANTSKLYGTADPMLPPPVESGQRNGDTVAQIGGAITRAGFGTFAGENVGVYDYAIGASQLGYALTLAGPPQLTITPAQLTVTPTSGQSKVYGQTDPALGYGSTGLVSATIDGVTLNDTEAGVLSGALDRAAGSNGGKNYSASTVASTNGLIAPKPLNSPSSLWLASSTGIQPRFEPSTGRIIADLPTEDAETLTPMGTFATNADGQEDAFLHNADGRIAINGVNRLRPNSPQLHIVDGGVELLGYLVETAESAVK